MELISADFSISTDPLIPTNGVRVGTARKGSKSVRMLRVAMYQPGRTSPNGDWQVPGESPTWVMGEISDELVASPFFASSPVKTYATSGCRKFQDGRTMLGSGWTGG